MKQYTPNQIKFISKEFQQAQKFIQNGNLNWAEKSYLNILQIDSNITEARNALAYIYTISGKYDKAVNQLQLLLRSDPNNASIHHNLGNCLYEQALYNDALQHYQKAIAYNPNYLDSYTQCAATLRKLEQNELALDYLNQALAKDPQNPKALYGLGITYAALGNFTQAIESTRKAISLAPNNQDYHLSLGKILECADLGHDADIQYHDTCIKFPDFADAFITYGKLLLKNRYYEQALECFKRAKQIEPSNLETLEYLANTYLSVYDTDNAIDYFNTILSSDPKHVSALIGLYQAYQELGKFDDAIDICNQIIAIDKTLPDGYILKSRAKKSTSDDGLAEDLSAFLMQPKLSDTDKININFALGKCFDDRKNYKAAFSHFSTANNLRKQELTLKTEHLINQMEQTIEAFSPGFPDKYKHLASESKRPILIVGMPRSGSTLTEQIISSHPQVLASGEVNYWSDVHKSLYFNSGIDSPDTKYIESLTSDQAQHIALNYETTLAKITGCEIMPGHFTDKMPHNFLYLGLISILFPNAKIIHTKRDPIDTCLSIYMQNFNNYHPYSFDLEELGRYYRAYEKLMLHWHHVLPGRILDVSYEDTIADPEYWSRRLIDFIGLDWDDRCLAPHKLERSVKTPSNWQVRQPIYKTSVQRWKNYEEYIQPLIQALNK